MPYLWPRLDVLMQWTKERSGCLCHVKLESGPVMIWKALLKQYGLIKFTLCTRYILKSIPYHPEEISSDLDLIKFDFNFDSDSMRVTRGRRHDSRLRGN